MEINLEIITIASNIAQTIGLLLAFFGVYINVKKWKESQNIQLFISLSNTFRNKWENGWGDTLDLVADKKGNIFNKTLVLKNEKEIRQMLNWIDWLGTLYSKKKISDIELITDSLGITIKRIINSGRIIIEKDISEEGAIYWKSLIFIGKKMNIEWMKSI